MKTSLAALLFLLALTACGRGGGEAFVAPRLAPGAPTRAWPPQGWAWGMIKLKDRPALRYGVSAPAIAPLGDIVILPGYGESAEWWFETAADLNREGYTVWVLEPEGQGGSGRATPVRDLGHTPDFDGDIKGLAAFVRLIVRPSSDRPPRLIASGTAALTALAAVERGLAADQVILTSPRELKVASSGFPAALAPLGIDTLRASGGEAWVRPAAGASATPRQKTALRWAVANPDLRMGGPSTGWLRARERLRATALSPENLRRATAPVVVLAPDGGPEIPCARLPRCMVRPLPGRLPYHIEDDRIRAAWLSALIGELGTDHAT